MPSLHDNRSFLRLAYRDKFHAAVPIRGLNDFMLSYKYLNDFILSNEQLTETHIYRPLTILYSVLLYTEEDVKLARFVRKHFEELDIMSGPELVVYFVEEPMRSSYEYVNSYFWKATIKKKLYDMWKCIGFIENKPYNKSSVYEIARKMGIYPDKFPCITIFDHINRSDKITISIEGNYSALFRHLFSSIQRHIDSVKCHILENNLSDDMSLYQRPGFIDDMYTNLRTSVNDAYKSNNGLKITGLTKANIKHKRKLLKLYKNRLQKREIQEAKFGVSADPIIKIEIEDLKNRIENIEQELIPYQYRKI